jgi:hypothetical protein
MHELDAIATPVTKHEYSTAAHIEPEIAFHDVKESVEALARIDGLGVQIDFDLGIQCEHLSDLFQNVRQEIDRMDWDKD